MSRGSRDRESPPFSFPSPSFSLFLPLKFDLRGRLRDSKNRITRRNEPGETQPVPRPLLSNLNLYASCEYTREQNSRTLLKQLSHLRWNIFFIIFSFFSRLTRVPQLDIPKARNSKRYHRKNIIGIRILIKINR